MRRLALLAITAAFSAVVAAVAVFPSPAATQLENTVAFEGPVPEARCGPGSLPETGLQGRVPLQDRRSGRSKLGYRCNLELVGQFQGEGSSWVSQSYEDCAYMSTRYPSDAEHPGVQVLDVSDPTNPARVGTLTDPAMLGTWETLKVNERRGLLAAVNAPSPGGNGVAFFAVYDIETDCSKPRLLSSVTNTDLHVPANTLGHEGNWSPDGRTYWAASLSGGVVTAIDVADTAHPRIVYTGQTSAVNHGLSVSPDGNRLYIAKIGFKSGAPLDGNGVQIFDVSQVQQRRPAPQIRLVGQALWEDGAIGQHAIHVTYDGRPHLVYVDEGGAGAARIFDITDEGVPRVVSKLKLQIHMPEQADARAADTEGTGSFGYEGHYCDVDRLTDPTALACGYFQSGVRVFDIRDPQTPREIAYYNPAAQVGKAADLESSEHAHNPLLSGTVLTADWCSSPPRFVGRQLWVTCQDNGFLTLRFTNGAYTPTGRSPVPGRD